MRKCSALLLVSVLVLAGCGENKFQKEVMTEASASKLAREVQAGQYDIVTTDELKAMVDGGEKFLLIDTMPFESSYKASHIPRALNFVFPIPIMEAWDDAECAGSQEDYAKLLGEDKDQLIVVYCGFTKCTRSHNGVVWAKKLGYTNVKRHPGGIYAWKGKGYPTASE